jgi:two-component system phosphate regulon sensor histidine kinase PhoR
MHSEYRTHQVILLTLLFLLCVSVVQTGWWFIDQRSYTKETTEALRDGYERQAEVFDGINRESLESFGDVQSRFPYLTIKDGRVAVDSSVLDDLVDRRLARINQYAWESGFFLVVLFGCIGILARAVHNEVRIRRTQDTFLATVSHEFRTPLASLRLAIETMEMRHPAGESQAHLLHRMNADLHRMEILITNVLDASQLASGRLNLANDRILLSPLVQDVLNRIASGSNNNLPAITIDIETDLCVNGDGMALATVVSNILENAIKAVADSPNQEIRLVAEQEGDAVRLDIADTGKGFSSAEANLLFEKFYQSEHGSGVRQSGTGLGLYIARRLMEMGGGRIAAKSNGPDTGACFSIFFTPSTDEPLTSNG